MAAVYHLEFKIVVRRCHVLARLFGNNSGTITRMLESHRFSTTATWFASKAETTFLLLYRQ
jgi:hypothetical protein